MAKEVSSWPSISVVVATYNSGHTLDTCLGLVRSQNYPQNKIEIILGDGGSTDATVAIAKKYRAKLISIDQKLQNAEYNRGVAYNAAKNDLVLILDHDNFFTSTNYLRELVLPLRENPAMVAVESCYYHYDPKADIIDRYYALFGTNEPLPYYLGKADRLPWLCKKWILFGQATEKNKYFIVKFKQDPRYIPSVGTNGCLMRRSLVNQYADVRPEHHYPIDVMVDVILAGHNEFGFVKNSIIHFQQSRGIKAYLERRWKFAQSYHFEAYAKRRWSVVLPGDEWKVAWFVLLSLTLIIPTLDALKGYLKVRDKAWFVHPLMCFATAIMYGVLTMKHWLINFYK